MDCMRCSIVAGEYHRIIEEQLPSPSSPSSTSSSIDVERILPLIIQSSRPYFLSSTLIITVVYFILSIASPISCARLLCITLILHVLLNYFLHCTFFSSCLVLTLERLQSHRHCLSCLRLSNDDYLQLPQPSRRQRFFSRLVQAYESTDSMIKKFAHGTLCLLSMILLFASLWLTLSIDTRLFDEKFLPRSADSLRSYMNSQITDYNIGPMIMLVVPDPVDYENELVRQGIHRFVQQCRNETMTNDFKLVWLEEENLHSILHEKGPLNTRMTPYSENDLIVSDGQNRSTIVASRVFCQFRGVKGK